MPASLNQHGGYNVLLRMHPLHRVLISMLVTLIVFFMIRNSNLKPAFVVTVLWDVFALSYIIICWIIFFKKSKEEIIKQANKDDGSKLFVLISVLITSFASLFAVMLLMISTDAYNENKLVSLLLAIAGMMLSWVMVHTLFAFHYAHMYYGDYDKKKNKAPDLSFPGDAEPDYLDFAYFSFVIGMTFQVSDVEIHSTKLRRTVLAHGLLAFALNTFVIALTINLVAGLRK
ncbi:MAG: DUF1345 domain-containing protein [Ferruginibacter sp.]